MNYIDDYDIYIAALLLMYRITCCISLDTNKWLDMIIYLNYCLSLIMCHFATKCSNIFICDLIDYVLCILLHFRLILSIFGMKQDSPRNTTILGDSPILFFLVFPDSRESP